MVFFEKQVESRTMYEGIVVKIRRDTAELQNGNRALREVVEHPGGVGIVPVTSDNKVLMVRQYRYPMEKELLEIPAGRLSVGEAPLDCAVRELSEETGCTAGKLVDFGEIYPSPGFCRETLYLYLALDLKYGEMHLDENELLTVETFDMDFLIGKIMSNEITDAKTIIGIIKAKMYLDESKGM
ncbi:MAG: NUDIX hydrolase [Oscillospiraceae bacterium]|jgi:ADP-ribose pyrophosphatase|nr:NUDIX hydrolase [Oscillospiraceae bacterium]